MRAGGWQGAGVAEPGPAGEAGGDNGSLRWPLSPLRGGWLPPGQAVGPDPPPQGSAPAEDSSFPLADPFNVYYIDTLNLNHVLIPRFLSVDINPIYFVLRSKMVSASNVIQ